MSEYTKLAVWIFFIIWDIYIIIDHEFNKGGKQE